MSDGQKNIVWVGAAPGSSLPVALDRAFEISLSISLC